MHVEATADHDLTEAEEAALERAQTAFGLSDEDRQLLTLTRDGVVTPAYLHDAGRAPGGRHRRRPGELLTPGGQCDSGIMRRRGSLSIRFLAARADTRSSGWSGGGWTGSERRAPLRCGVSG